MDIIDGVRTTVAVLVGYLVSVTGIELLPALSTDSVVVPVSVGLAAGVVATIGLRRLLGTTNYGPLAGAMLFAILGAALLAQGSDGPVPPEQARLLLWIAAAGLIVNELLVHTSRLIQAGGIEQTDHHRVWAVPAALIGLIVIVARRADLDGAGPALGLATAVAGVGAHVALVSLAMGHPTVLFGVAASALFVLFPASSPQQLGTATGAGSIIDAGRAAGSTAATRIIHTVDRGIAAGRLTADRLRAVLPVVPMPTRGATAVGAADEPAMGAGAASGERHQSPGEANTAQRSQASSGTSTPTTDGGAQAVQSTSAAGPSTTAAPEAGGDQQPSQRVCQNCGRRRGSVRPRPIVTTESDRVSATIELCACCHAARRCADTACEDPAPMTRKQAVRESDGRCRACGRGPASVLELHPIVPLASRGHRHERNVAALCPTCHASIHDHQDAQFSPDDS